MLDNVVHILVTSAGEIDKDTAVIHCLCKLHTEGHRVGAFDSGNNALHTGQLEESVNGLFVVDDIILYSAQIVKECVLGAGGRIVKSACYRV